ncbi:hypothetical protein GFS31_40960 (plasmid) [Leptolyngbya sp. BL0902]|nr:hypothetical protein GFS31_40960 [Leptolyngbya sp. BL0902]
METEHHLEPQNKTDKSLYSLENSFEWKHILCFPNAKLGIFRAHSLLARELI